MKESAGVTWMTRKSVGANLGEIMFAVEEELRIGSLPDEVYEVSKYAS